MNRSFVNPGTIVTLGAELERDRLTQRARRITAVIAALRQQATRSGAEAYARRHIQQAIREFEAEVAAIDARLIDLAAGTTPRSESRWPPGIGRRHEGEI